MKQILKILVALGVIAFAASMLALSCGKTAGGGNNNSGGGNGGGGGCTGICPTTNLTLSIPPGLPGYVKLSGNMVTLNATALATITPHSDADPANRGFDDAQTAGSALEIFNIAYPGAIGVDAPAGTVPGSSAIMYFVNRPHVTKDTIAMSATATPCPSSETDDALLAVSAGGGTCRGYSGNSIDFDSYLGTVFNNIKDTSHARGLMKCNSRLSKALPAGGGDEVISDTTIFNYSQRTACIIAMVNSGLGTGVKIDDAWVTDSGSTTEVELYAIGIDVTGKTIPQFLSETGYNLAEFIKAHDNARFKKLLQNNPWADLKFKVKIVIAANF